MLFSTICLQAILCAAVPSVIAGSSTPVDGRYGDLLSPDANLTIVSGKPELAKHEKLRIRASDLVARDLNNDESEALRIHNVARSKHNLPNLVWDDNLKAGALQWAIELARRGSLDHSSSDQRPNAGENLGMVGSSGTIPNPITLSSQGWVNEESNYHGEVIPQGDFNSYGHYTQVVWRSTTNVGIATASDGKGGWWTVARYSPPGNWVGQTPY
ncbi:Fc.00g055810.m01.CDS01 [Cosmosporella sp. VM-42]